MACELNLGPGTPPSQMPVQELQAVVGVEAEQTEGLRRANLLDGVHDRFLILAQNAPGSRPGGLEVGDVEGIDKFSAAGVAGMRHQVHLGEANTARYIPLPSAAVIC